MVSNSAALLVFNDILDNAMMMVMTIYSVLKMSMHSQLIVQEGREKSHRSATKIGTMKCRQYGAWKYLIHAQSVSSAGGEGKNPIVALPELGQWSVDNAEHKNHLASIVCLLFSIPQPKTLRFTQCWVRW